MDYTDGRSSFREIMGPLYLGLADMLLQSAAERKNEPGVPTLLIEARRTVELLKTAEIRDYFKDQCLLPLEAQKVVAASAAEFNPYGNVVSDRAARPGRTADRRRGRAVSGDNADH